MTSEIYRLKEQQSVLVTFIIGIALFFVSQLPLFETTKGWEITGHVVAELGVAIVIGGYLSITIERLNKLRTREEVNEYIKDVGDNFIKAVYGKSLPNELFEVVKNLVFDKPFIKTSLWNNIYLYDFNDKYIETINHQRIKELLKRFIEATVNREVCENRVIFKTRIHYTVMNVSAKEMKYPVNFGFKKPLAGKYEGLCGIVSLAVNGQELIPDGGYFSSKTQDDSEDETSIGFMHEVEIPSGESVEVDMEAYSLLKSEDSQAWFSSDIQKGARFVITDESGNKDIFIRFGVPHLIKLKQEANKNLRTNTAILETDQYLLPGQGFEIHWMPK